MQLSYTELVRRRRVQKRIRRQRLQRSHLPLNVWGSIDRQDKKCCHVCCLNRRHVIDTSGAPCHTRRGGGKMKNDSEKSQRGVFPTTYCKFCTPKKNPLLSRPACRVHSHCIASCTLRGVLPLPCLGEIGWGAAGAACERKRDCHDQHVLFT